MKVEVDVIAYERPGRTRWPNAQTECPQNCKNDL